MKFFICRATDFNYTLIPFTDWEIIRATRYFFPDSEEHFFGASADTDKSYLLKMHNAVISEQPMMSFDTVGKIGLQQAQFAIEKKRLSYYSDAPYSFHSYISGMPQGSTATYSDRSFKLFHDHMKLAGLWNLNPVFNPHGGPCQLRAAKSISERQYPVVFVGR
ncbi:MAG: hypothetical protein R3261_15355, partial [Alphaproteobacteria bacterium]|nr:hypothetical protein [Alphaproteobacteria bacterium]